MELLVSVRDSREAKAALSGGAHIIDAKEPDAGALGAVSLHVLRTIVTEVGGTRPVTAALGDARDEDDLLRDARAFVDAGASLVKVGFARIPSPARVASLLEAAAAGAGHRRVIAVAYADHAHVGACAADAVLEAAATAQVAGILLDTADKNGPGVATLLDPRALAAWVSEARRRGLQNAVAGRLAMDDLPQVFAASADIAGVRGAACDHGRRGSVSAARVRALVQHLQAISTVHAVPQ